MHHLLPRKWVAELPQSRLFNIFPSRRVFGTKLVGLNEFRRILVPEMVYHHDTCDA